MSPSIQRLAALLQEHGKGMRVLVQACPGLAEVVERGELGGAATEALVASFIDPLIAQGADTIVLGCTHYPFHAETIRRIAGPDVTVIDPSAAVARELHRRLGTAKLLSSRGQPGTERFWTSGDPDMFARSWRSCSARTSRCTRCPRNSHPSLEVKASGR